jgi:hypothetical protein
MHRLLVTGILVLALAVSSCSGDSSDSEGSVAPSSSSTTSTQPANRDVEVEFVYGPPDWPLTGDRSPLGLLAHGVANYTGDWTATSTFASGQQSVDGAYGGFTLSVLDGEVTGCGSGQFLFFDAFASLTPTGGWLIIPGFGTQDLASLSGSGVWETLDGVPGGATAGGAIRGSVTCTGEDVSPQRPWFEETPDAGSVEVDASAAFPAPRTLWETTLSAPEGSVEPPIALSDGSVTMQFTGTWAGDAPTVLATATRPSADGGLVEAMVMRFTGTVDGCGTGSLIVNVLDRVDAQDAPAVRSWEIIPGLGTGDLVGATGLGTGTVNTGEGTSTFEGSMSCQA